MYLAKTQTCLSYLYVGCKYREEKVCKVQMERWRTTMFHRWPTVSAVAWHARLQHYCSRRRNVPKSKPCLQHQPIRSCTCCRPISKSCCREQHTRKRHLTSHASRYHSVRLGYRMVSLLLLLLRLTLCPPYLCDVIHCGCRVEGKKYRTAVCGYDKEYLSWI